MLAPPHSTRIHTADRVTERETTPVHHFVNVCHKGNRHSAADDIVDIGRGEDPVDSRAKYTEP